MDGGQHEPEGPLGLDERPRPASTRARLVRGLIQSAPFSSLQRRIIFFNLIGLAFLVLGVLYLNQFRSGLIEQRVLAMRTQGEIIAIGIAEAAALIPGDPNVPPGIEQPTYEPVRANIVLNRLVQPTGVRAQLFDKKARLTGDTRSLSIGGGPIEVRELPKLGEERESGSLSWIERIYEDASSWFRDTPEIYQEVPRGGISEDPEVQAALQGRADHAVRVNSDGELIVSVALPIRRFKAVLGVLVLSTEGGDINQIVRDERIAILRVFIIATIVSVALSVLLANTIARPIRRLANAAEEGRIAGSAPLNPGKIQIPDLTSRSDEIGYLSGAMRRMTDALVLRITAIESFAADVAHEIKNPLTSLRSAVETMHFAKTDKQRDRLLAVIQNDVSRMDRLVTDISNASRLDAELVREEMRRFNLGNLISMLCEVSRNDAEPRDVEIDLNLPEGGLQARGLESRLGQVFANLLDNAVSFSPDGSRITVRGVRLPEGGARITVEDQGPGIPEDNLATIFERFYTERPEAQGFGNHSGLGLSISRQIVHAHAGKIWAENIRPAGADPDSQPLGARFTVELPG